MYVCTLFKVDQVLAVQSANKNQLLLNRRRMVSIINLHTKRSNTHTKNKNSKNKCNFLWFNYFFYRKLNNFFFGELLNYFNTILSYPK